jgi:hypothetical protein
MVTRRTDVFRVTQGFKNELTYGILFVEASSKRTRIKTIAANFPYSGITRISLTVADRARFVV